MAFKRFLLCEAQFSVCDWAKGHRSGFDDPLGDGNAAALADRAEAVLDLRRGPRTDACSEG